MSINKQVQQRVLDLIQNFQIEKLCDQFFSEKFLWIVKGSGLLSKTYTDKNVYLNEALKRLGTKLLPGGKLHILNTYVVDDTLIIELCGEMQAKNGKHYNNEYCWIIKFNHDKIVSITAYLDTLLLDNILLNSE